MPCDPDTSRKKGTLNGAANGGSKKQWFCLVDGTIQILVRRVSRQSDVLDLRMAHEEIGDGAARTDGRAEGAESGEAVFGEVNLMGFAGLPLLGVICEI